MMKMQQNQNEEMEPTKEIVNYLDEMEMDEMELEDL